MDEKMRKLFEDRGIDPRGKVVGERPYKPYRAGSGMVFAEDPKYRNRDLDPEGQLLPGQVQFVRRIVNQRDGVIMRRHAGLPDSPEPWAQIRPHREGDDDPGVLIQTFSHRHPWAYIHRHVRNVWPADRGEAIALDDPRADDIVVTGAGGGDIRIRPNPRKDGVQQRRMNSLRWLREHERNHSRGPDRLPPELEADFALGGMHAHWWDWTAHLKTGEYADQHGPDLKLGAWHVHQDYARYLYAPKDPNRPESGKERAAGIDVHPLADDKLNRGGQRAYYAIEGVLKNDALLEKGVPVFNTGSVTLWLPDELQRFARERLAGRFGQVIVVPDSDWHSNPQVSRQANRVADLLRSEWLDVVIAAPPAKCGPVCRHRERAKRKDHKNGVDDFLGKGGTVRQLIALHVDRERAAAGIAQKRRVALLLEHATTHCDASGNVYQSIDEMADAVGVDRKTIIRAIADAEDEGLIRYTVPDPEPGQRSPVGTLTLRKGLRPRISFEEIGA